MNSVLDEMRFYTRTLDTNEILQDFNDGVSGIKSSVDTASLNAAWSFDEGEGTTTADSSGLVNTGYLGTGLNAPVWVLEQASPPVPEPTSLILLGISLAVSPVIRRFQRK